MTLDQIKAFWQALPDSAWFEGYFEARLNDVAAADAEVQRLTRLLAHAEKNRARALNVLNDRVEAVAAQSWNSVEITAARIASGKEVA